MSQFRTAPVATTEMPNGIPFIVGNEAAERFSFYGMKTILAVYMADYLHFMGNTAGVSMGEAAANEKVHLFNSAVYITPFLGAIFADVFLGKYRTIIWLSLVYCMGHAALAMMGSTGSAYLWLFFGLALISLGSGGIKPCVSAHVGDQFGKSNRNLLTRAYNFFYFSINVGAFISTMLTPWLLQRYGPHWAFGVPGVLMALATLLFWMGRKRFVHIPAKGRGFVKEAFSKEAVAAIGKLAVVFGFVAVFWALFDQTASSWVFQSKNMDRNWLGFEWLPSQVQAINPIFILIFIPVFTFIVYPTINKVFRLTPLRKISIGLFVMVVGFAIVALVQQNIDGGGRPSIAWQILAYVLLTAAEVMVSIVALEFAYTQAPKAIKSIVLALFLASVSLGNFFTAGVNHFIQIGNPVTVLESPAQGGTVTHPGHDKESGTPDDFQVVFNGDGVRESISIPSQSVVDEAIARIEEAGTGALPTTEEGSKIVADLKDQWGNPVDYRLQSSDQFRVSSPGPDGKLKTEWDLGATVVRRTESNDTSLFDMLIRAVGVDLPESTWLEKRKEELRIESKQDVNQNESPLFSRQYFVGGQLKLEGASYFWFFTAVMLAAAIGFVLVAFLYKEQTYLQDEEQV